MDSRITQKIEAIKKAERDQEEKARKAEIAYEKKRKQEVKDKMPQARAFVEKYMLTKIAELEIKGVKELHVPSGFQNPYNYNDKEYLPPQESIVAALKEVEGLTIKSEWIPSWTGHLNSDDCMETIDAHYSYTVTWK